MTVQYRNAILEYPLKHLKSLLILSLLALTAVWGAGCAGRTDRTYDQSAVGDLRDLELERAAVSPLETPAEVHNPHKIPLTRPTNSPPGGRLLTLAPDPVPANPKAMRLLF
jgi:hypothetical protein